LFREGVFDFARGNVHNQLCKLVRIAWALWSYHALRMTPAERRIKTARFQTETLPRTLLTAKKNRVTSGAMSYDQPGEKKAPPRVVDLNRPGQIVQMYKGTYIVDENGALRKLEEKRAGKK